MRVIGREAKCMTRNGAAKPHARADSVSLLSSEWRGEVNPACLWLLNPAQQLYCIERTLWCLFVLEVGEDISSLLKMSADGT